MKRHILFAAGLYLALSFAQAKAKIAITVTAGSLSTILTETELNSMTDLTLNGSMDARDFSFIRSGRFYRLKTIDLSNVEIAAYAYYPKNQLPSSAFLRCTFLTAIILPNSITSIGDSAIYRCSALTSIIIPDSVSRIGVSAFHYCTNLVSVKLSSNLKKIEDFAFFMCVKLSSATIPPALEHIGDWAFELCALTSLKFPKSVSFIGNGAFYDCNALISLTLPESVKHIGKYAFAGCGIMEVTIPTSLDSILDQTFRSCTNLAIIKIPNSVHYIGTSAFSDCSSLTSITIPDSVSYIGENAFYNCTGLTTFQVSNPIPIDLSSSPHVFDFIDKHLCTLYVPSGALSAYVSAVNWNDFVRISEINGVVPPETGDSTDIVKSISVIAGELTNTLTANELSNITELTLTGSINYRDFAVMRYMMPKLSKLNLKGCSIKEFNTKYQQNEIPYDAFRNCSTLTSIVFPATLVSIDQYAFSNCTCLKNIVFSDSMFHIGVYAFLGCTALTSVELPPYIGMIEAGAFMSCSSLTKINFPNSIEYIGAASFLNCTNLESVVLPRGLEYINGMTFKACSKLTTVILPSSLIEIGAAAFEGCESLTTITIPESVSIIGAGAFYCYNLKSIYSFSEWPADCASETTFGKSVETCKLYLSIGSKEKYLNATGWRNFKDITEMVMVSQESALKQDLRIWINQSTNTLLLDDLEASARIALIDLNGRHFQTTIGERDCSISMNGLPNGLYFVQVTTSKGVHRQKILINSN